jgi:hypothetical protein
VSTIEFILIPISIVVGLAIARLLEGLYVVSESEKRYWVHTLWLCNKFGQVLIYIWSWHAGGSVGAVFEGDPTFMDLVLSMCTPSIIFLQALALLGQSPSSSEDWTDHFYACRTRFFTLNVALILFNGIGTVVFNTASFVPFLGLFFLNVVGLTTANRRAHAAIVCVAVVVMALGVAIPILRSS